MRTAVSRPSTVIYLAVGILILVAGYYAVTSLPPVTRSSGGSDSVGSSSEVPEYKILITSAELTPSGDLTLTVENTGNIHLVGLSIPYLIPPSGKNATGSWDPSPSVPYPIYPGQTAKGSWVFGAEYAPGLQVQVAVRGDFLCPNAGLCSDTTALNLTVSSR